MPFSLIFRTPTAEYRTNHYGLLENEKGGILRVVGCIDPAKYERLDGLGRNEHQLLENMEPELREKTFLVLQVGNNHNGTHHRTYTVIPELVDRIIYQYCEK